METSKPVMRLIMVGACYIDTVLTVPKFPQEDDKLRAKSLKKRRGGNVANTLEVLQQLVRCPPEPSIDLDILCVLPALSSPATNFIKDSFGPEVNLSLCIHREHHEEAACSFIIKAADTGSRTIVNHNDLPEMTVDEFQHLITKSQSARAPRTWYHFEGRIPETSVACMRWLKQRYPDVVLSAEVEKPGREGLDGMAAEAHVVFFSQGWARAAGYDEVGAFLEVQAEEFPHARLLCCTWGSEGAAVIAPRDGVYHHEPAFVDPERQVVDTVGAGDTFIAGVLYKLLTSKETDAKDTLAFANRLAGRKVLQDGFANLS